MHKLIVEHRYSEILSTILILKIMQLALIIAGKYNYMYEVLKVIFSGTEQTQAIDIATT